MNRALMLKTAVVAGVVVGGGFLALAQPDRRAEAQPPRTVEYYVDRPEELARLRTACRDDPGYPRIDCPLLHQIEGTLYLRRQRAAERPEDQEENPEYWSLRPDRRQGRLVYCGNLAPDFAAQDRWCIAARESARRGQGSAAR